MLTLTGGLLGETNLPPGEERAPLLCPVLGRPALGEDFSAAYILPISKQEHLSFCLFILLGAMV